MAVRDIELDGGFNVRDLGGYPTRDGGVTKKGVLVRSGTLTDITPDAQTVLVDYGVKTIIDIRDEWEVEHYPDAPAQSDVMRYRNIPFIGDHLNRDEKWHAQAGSHKNMYEVYAYYLEHCQPQIREIMTTLIESEPTTLYHCYAGKDRTGMISAFILGAVGVADDIIVQDYAETTPRISHLVKEWRVDAVKNKRDMQKFERDVSSDAHTMVNFLAHVQERYGGITAFLNTCGVTSADLNELKARLVG